MLASAITIRAARDLQLVNEQIELLEACYRDWEIALNTTGKFYDDPGFDALIKEAEHAFSNTDENGLTSDDREGIRRGIADIEAGRVYTDEEVDEILSGKRTP